MRLCHFEITGPAQSQPDCRDGLNDVRSSGDDEWDIVVQAARRPESRSALR
jgi:hypothetical protein